MTAAHALLRDIGGKRPATKGNLARSKHRVVRQWPEIEARARWNGFAGAATDVVNGGKLMIEGRAGSRAGPCMRALEASESENV